MVFTSSSPMAWTIQLHDDTAPEIGPLEERVDPVWLDVRL
jgi:hypothetical protein